MLQCLNDECLLKIFEYLDLCEQVNLTMVDERFRTLIIERIWRMKFHIFKHSWLCKTTLDKFERKMFLRLLAPHITELSFFDDNEDDGGPSPEFYFSLKYPELRKLYLQGEYFRNNYLMGIAPTSPKLELLSFTNKNDPLYSIEEFVCYMPNLQKVSLTTSAIEPNDFKKIVDDQKIKNVRFFCGASTTKKQEWNRVLKTIFPKITTMRYNDHCDWSLKAEVLKSAHLFQNLEILHVKDSERSIDFVCSLHTLRVLHLESCRMQMDDLLKVIDNNVHLEHLYVYIGLLHRDNTNVTLAEQRFAGEGVCKMSDLRRQQQENEPCKRLLNIHLYKPRDLPHILEDHDSNQGHQEPIIKIVELRSPGPNYIEPRGNFLDFML